RFPLLPPYYRNFRPLPPWVILPGDRCTRPGAGPVPYISISFSWFDPFMNRLKTGPQPDCKCFRHGIAVMVNPLLRARAPCIHFGIPAGVIGERQQMRAAAANAPTV